MSSSSHLTDHRFYQQVYEHMPVTCFVLDDQLTIVSINQFGLNQLGIKDEAIESIKLLDLYTESNRQFVAQQMQEFAEHHRYDTMSWECTRIRRDGSHYWVRDTIRALPAVASNVGGYLLISEDITETHYLVNELQKKASTDVITGLINRIQFEKYIGEAILSAQSDHETHTLGYLNLKQFKVVNDVCGHQAGNDLLRQIGRLLQDNTRPEDHVSRLECDEFGILLVGCSIDDAEHIMSAILEAISKLYFRWENEIFDVSANIGMVSINTHGGANTTADFLEMADSACYTARAKGNNYFELFRTGDQQTIQRSEIRKYASRINWALENDRFELHFQEIRALHDRNHEQHMEILIRMRDQFDELVFPGAFIPAAEYYGLSTKIDLWVTRKVLEYFQENPITDQLICNVNLSAQTLASSDFIDQATTLIKNNRIPGLILCFEITETSAIDKISQAIQFLTHFRSLGCRFALDDFGSGFSSFAYLQSLHLDYLKIDGQFISQLTKRPTDISLVKAIQQVADAFNIHTVAEFVESEGIVTVLKGLGIDYGQGYHIHKPEPLK